MRKILLGATVLISLLSCGPSTAPAAPGPAGAVTAVPEPVTQASTTMAYVILHGLGLWSEDGGKAKWLEALTIGDAVTLSGASKNLTLEGKDKSFVQVKTVSGKEGWVLPQYLAQNAKLAVVKAEGAILYSEPRDVKVTGKALTRLTVLAVYEEGKSDSFVKINAYDPFQDAFFPDFFTGIEDLTLEESDVNLAILLQLARASKKADVTKAILTTAVNKYPASMFSSEAAVALEKLAPKPRPASAFAGSFVVNEGEAPVFDQPNEIAGNRVASLKKDMEVSVIEATDESFTLNGVDSKWFRITDPAGWVFGSYLTPK